MTDVVIGLAADLDVDLHRLQAYRLLGLPAGEAPPATLREMTDEIAVIDACGGEYGTWVSAFLDRAFAN